MQQTCCSLCNQNILNEMTGLFHNTVHTGRLLYSLFITASAMTYFKYKIVMTIYFCLTGCFCVNHKAFFYIEVVDKKKGPHSFSLRQMDLQKPLSVYVIDCFKLSFRSQNK